MLPEYITTAWDTVLFFKVKKKKEKKPYLEISLNVF